MEEESLVRAVLQKSAARTAERRSEKRLAAQSRRRGITETGDSGSCGADIPEREVRRLVNLCKSGKISAPDLKILSQALMKKANADLFTAEDGSLHALVGLLTGKDSSKQPLAFYCLANLAAAAPSARPLQLARAAGPYLITQLTDAVADSGGGGGAAARAAELACTVLANLAMAGDRQAVRVLVNQDVVPTLARVVRGSSSSTGSEALQEVVFLTIYHIIIQAELEADTLSSLAQICLGRLSGKPPIHLLWVLFSLSSNQLLHSHLATASLISTCMEIATYEIFQKCDSRPLVKVLTPVVRLLANLAAGPESVAVCLALVRHPDFPAIMTALLTTNYISLCQETVWLFANIVNNENVTVQEEFVDLDLMDRLENHAVSAIGKLDPYFLHRQA